MALNISMTTRMLSETVEAERASGPVKMAQSMREKAEAAPHWWKCVWVFGLVYAVRWDGEDPWGKGLTRCHSEI